MKLRPVADYTQTRHLWPAQLRLTYQVALLVFLHERNDASQKKSSKPRRSWFLRVCNGKPKAS